MGLEVINQFALGGCVEDCSSKEEGKGERVGQRGERLCASKGEGAALRVEL